MAFHHVAITTRDLAATHAFYTEVMGFELVRVDGNSAAVRLTGVCAGCPSAHMTLHVGIEAALRDEIPEFDTLHLA